MANRVFIMSLMTWSNKNPISYRAFRGSDMVKTPRWLVTNQHSQNVDTIRAAWYTSYETECRHTCAIASRPLFLKTICQTARGPFVKDWFQSTSRSWCTRFIKFAVCTWRNNQINFKYEASVAAHCRYRMYRTKLHFKHIFRNISLHF